MDHTEPSAHGQQHPIGIYLKIWGLLFVLSTMSYLVDYFHVQGLMRWTLIIVFMIAKAGLIVSVFMHMMWERLALVYAPDAAAGVAGADGVDGGGSASHLWDARPLFPLSAVQLAIKQRPSRPAPA